jgi:hypothetical protein
VQEKDWSVDGGGQVLSNECRLVNQYEGRAGRYLSAFVFLPIEQGLADYTVYFFYERQVFNSGKTVIVPLFLFFSQAKRWKNGREYFVVALSKSIDVSYNKHQHKQDATTSV